REGWPVGVFWQVGADFRVLQDVHISELLTTAHDGLSGFRREATLRGIRRAFHVKQNGVVGNLLFNSFNDIHEAPRLNFPTQLSARWRIVTESRAPCSVSPTDTHHRRFHPAALRLPPL